MSVARSDDGSNAARRRGPRKPNLPPPGPPGPSGPSGPHEPSEGGATATATAPTRNVTPLDDLYRLPMPKLFAVAERDGLAEHTGMNRGQLIVAMVRRQIERGDIVRGSGTLEVLPD